MPPGRLQTVWLSVAATMVGFLLPWARLDVVKTKTEKQIAANVSRAAGKAFGSGQLKRRSSGSKPKRGAMIPTTVSGMQVPRLANREQAKVAMRLMELVTKKPQHLGVKSYAVYLLPGLAMLCGVLLHAHGMRRPLRVSVAVLCAVVAAVGCWKLLTVDTRALFAVRIGEGLWLSLAGYVGLALAAGLPSVGAGAGAGRLRDGPSS